MKGKALKYIILLAVISVAGVLLFQFILFRISFRNSEKQFRESAAIALKEVSWQISKATGIIPNFDSIAPIEIISNENYLVRVNGYIDEKLLKFHLIQELKKHNIFTSFEYAIFNRSKGLMEKGTLVGQNSEEIPSGYKFPMSTKFNNYFGVHFPNRVDYFNTKLSVWYFLSGLLIIILVFFGYTIYVIFRQRQLSEIQKNFINNLTHELKTPISAIGLSASVLLDEQIIENPKRFRDYARIIQEQNNRLALNVEKVLNLATIEKNKLHLNLIKLDLNKFLTETVDHFKLSGSGQKVQIHFEFDVSNPVITADKFHFANLISNILENAVKYCERSPEIRIRTQKLKNNTEFSIADNGIGIPRQHRKKIFTKFYRVPTGNVYNVKGFGLGLDYVYKIVKAHKWRIRADENPAGGSIFTITIH